MLAELVLRESMKPLLEPEPLMLERESQSAVQNPACAEVNSGPVFVIGMWRSGTSLFYALLNQHPDIALMYEGDLWLLRPLFWFRGGASRLARRWQFWNEAITRHKIEPERLASGSSSFRENLESAYRETARQKGARLFGEKSPNYYDAVLELARDFPEARFIVIWRDPAAISRSILDAAKGRSSWFTRRGMIVRTLLGFKVMRDQCDRAVSQGVHIHQVQYEEFVQDPVRTMKEVCRFLGVPFVSSMASLQSADRSAIYEGWHHSLVQGKEIIPSRSAERGETLPLRIRKKIDRYMALWRKQTHGAWPPPSQGTEELNPELPSLLERFVDACAYRYFRAFDSAVSILYSYAPFSALRVWRRLVHSSHVEVGE
jgi:Sulfotransferase family